MRYLITFFVCVAIATGCTTPMTTGTTTEAGVSPLIAAIQKIGEKDAEIRTQWKMRSDANFQAWVEAQSALDTMAWEVIAENTLAESEGKLTIEELKTLMAIRQESANKIEVKRAGYNADIAAVEDRAEMNDTRKAALMAAFQNQGQDMAKGVGMGAALGALFALLALN